ncbi:unnamed protein product [Trichogramma brassicae]|uniref:Uncharacterized protein n=1 Tax=Trichogramma brassicae TaxID=86971 RepID=A0A6H5IJ81_9HYME|nr:unnamed protein product [Trichogramma brassicae]
MECVPPHQLQRPGTYLPHHEVFRADNPEKIRVVFNASSKSSDGLSLNNQLLTGAKLQANITVVLSNSRFFEFAGTTDVKKMFHQIRVHEDDIDLQRVLWRASPMEPIRAFRCTTVTYGTAAAPFLALRVMKQLAGDRGEAYSEASRVLQHQLYVDDLFFGAGSLEEAIRRRDELIALLASAGMRLAKWAASHARIVEDLTDTTLEAVALKMDEAVCTLGLKWLPRLDYFTFQFRPALTASPATRRTVLSDIARTFDPMGWLSPVLIVAKILLQDICIDGTDWDAPIAGTLDQRWTKFCAALDDVSNIKMPRWFGTSEAGSWHLHAFADTSKRAYAAALYAVISSGLCRLIVAKTKLAPTEVQTVPRLELCVAALLVRLVKSLLDGLRFPPERIFCWSDSSVVLEWIRGHPSKWPTFVANRVSSIQTTCLTFAGGMCQRRITRPIVLLEGCRRLTWPHFGSGGMALLGSSTKSQRGRLSSIRHPSSRRVRALSFNKMVKVLCHCRRWLAVVGRTKVEDDEEDKWREAQFLCLRRVQVHHFRDDLKSVTAGDKLPKKSQLKKLHPFISDGGLLRVGSRLQHAPLSYDEKFPIILPGRCLIVKRLIELAHEDTLHGGPQLMRSHLRRMFWILHGPCIVHTVYQNCVRCARFRAAALEQLMGPLPAVRVTSGRPFQATGLDYAGSLPVLFSRGTQGPIYQRLHRHLHLHGGPSGSRGAAIRYATRTTPQSADRRLHAQLDIDPHLQRGSEMMFFLSSDSARQVWLALILFTITIVFRGSPDPQNHGTARSLWNNSNSCVRRLKFQMLDDGFAKALDVSAKSIDEDPRVGSSGRADGIRCRTPDEDPRVGSSGRADGIRCRAPNEDPRVGSSGRADGISQSSLELDKIGGYQIVRPQACVSIDVSSDDWLIPSARPDEPTRGSSFGARHLIPSARPDEPTRGSSSGVRHLIPSARPDEPTRGSSSAYTFVATATSYFLRLCPRCFSSTSTSPDHSGQFPQQQQHLQLPQKTKPKPQRKNLPNQKPQEKHVSKAVDAKDGELSSSDEEIRMRNKLISRAIISKNENHCLELCRNRKLRMTIGSSSRASSMADCTRLKIHATFFNEKSILSFFTSCFGTPFFQNE